MFYLCPHCDRGQRYCSSRCREKSRRQQRREANRRYQQSLGLEGRLDHRQRQREYRQRLKARVTDQSSLACFPLCESDSASGSAIASNPLRRQIFPCGPDAEYAASWVVCQICGRRGRWVNPFPEVKHDYR